MSYDFSLSPFERRLKAAVIIALASAKLLPLHAASFAGIYLLLSEVTLSALVCPRSRKMQLFGYTIMVLLSFLVEQSIHLSPDFSSAVFAASVMVALLLLVEYGPLLVFFRRYGSRWRPGTDLMITRIASQAERANHRVSWFVHANEELGPTHFRTIMSRFCDDCPLPIEPHSGVQVCLRAVQFYASQDGFLMHRFSGWCSPQQNQPVELTFPQSPIGLMDNFVSRYFGISCLVVFLLIELHFVVMVSGMSHISDLTKEEVAARVTQMIVTALAVLAFLWALLYAEEACNVIIHAICLIVRSFFQFICSLNHKMRACAKKAFNAVKKLLKSIRSGGEWASEVAVQVGPAIAKYSKLIAMALLWMAKAAVTVVGAVYEGIVHLLAYTVMAYIVFSIVRFSWECVKSIGSAALSLIAALIGSLSSIPLVLKNLLHGVTEVVHTALILATFAFVGLVLVSGCLAVAALAVVVAAILSRALVLTVKAVLDECKSFVASGYRQHTILKSQLRSSGRRRNLDHRLGRGNATASTLITTIWEDLIRQANEEAANKERVPNRLRVAREQARRSYEAEKAAEKAAARPKTTTAACVLPRAVRPPRRSSRLAALVASTNTSSASFSSSSRAR